MKDTRIYKQTELGLLPEDWEVARLGDIGELAMCKRIFQNETSEMGDVPFFKIGTFGKTADAYISYAKYNEFKSAYRFPNKGDILISAAGTIGRIVVYDGKPAYFQDSNIVWLAHNGKTIRNDFLFYVYQITDWNTENTTIARLYNDNFNKTIIPLPPIEEQRRIASALTNIDNLLDSLDRLIAKKRDIKQGTMQQLLSGKKRLKGFTEPWVKKKLGDIGYFLKGSGISKSQANSGTLCAVRYGELYTLHHNSIKTYNSHISMDVAQFATKIHKGDILFACSGETKEEIGKCAAFVDDVEAYAGGDILILRTDQEQCSDIFLGFLLNMPIAANQKAAKGQGDAIVHISKEALSNINCLFPSKEEQQAIASVLTSMDNELSALEAKRKKYEQIKQGMMQQLLTGKIRLVS